MSELAQVSGVRYSTIKYYSELGILPYFQEETRLARRYDRDEAIRRLKDIQKLKDKRLSIEEIAKHYKR
jgi:DNA-binding transcriptional MerR regulator